VAVRQSNSARSILVVDDDVRLRKVIEIALKSAGHTVIGTCGRDEILALLQSKQFDLIITDVLMPDIEGTEVIKAVKTHQPDAAILAMSGGGSHLTPELCLAVATAMGAEIPLLKPFEIPVLLRAVNRALGLGGAGQGPPEPPSSSH
jgi:two-component system response regulator AtoC